MTKNISKKVEAPRLISPTKAQELAEEGKGSFSNFGGEKDYIFHHQNFMYVLRTNHHRGETSQVYEMLNRGF